MFFGTAGVCWNLEALQEGLHFFLQFSVLQIGSNPDTQYLCSFRPKLEVYNTPKKETGVPFQHNFPLPGRSPWSAWAPGFASWSPEGECCWSGCSPWTSAQTLSTPKYLDLNIVTTLWKMEYMHEKNRNESNEHTALQQTAERLNW